MGQRNRDFNDVMLAIISVVVIAALAVAVASLGAAFFMGGCVQ
jgi:hypothetical protein